MDPDKIAESITQRDVDNTRYAALLNAQRHSSPVRSMSGNRLFSRPVPIDQAIRNEKGKLENASLLQDIKLKKYTLIALFCFLAVETVLIFVMSFFQGFKAWGFLMEEWSFRLLVSATITQITFMLLIAVRHLFPQKHIS